MSDRIVIPADQWPEWADRLCFDADGQAYFYGARMLSGGTWMTADKPADIPMPAGWDWRVPVMRPSAEEVRAQANIDAGWYARREAHAHDMGYAGVAEALEDLESRRNAPAIDLEQFRMLAQGSVDALTQNKVYPADVAAAVGHMRRLLALIDGQAKQPAPPSTPVRVSWADFWIAQGDWPTANDYAAFEKAEQWLLAQQPAAPEGCGACGDGYANRSGGCRLAAENPPAAPSGEAVAPAEGIIERLEAERDRCDNLAASTGNSLTRQREARLANYFDWAVREIRRLAALAAQQQGGRADGFAANRQEGE